MYNLVEEGINYSKISGRLWQYCRDKWDQDNFTYTESFKFYQNLQIIQVTVVLLTLFSYEISFDLTWFPNSIICKPDTATTFAITKRKPIF